MKWRRRERRATAGKANIMLILVAFFRFSTAGRDVAAHEDAVETPNQLN